MCLGFTIKYFVSSAQTWYASKLQITAAAAAATT